MVGYASLTDHPDQGELGSQTRKIAAACALRGLSLVEIAHEREPRRGQALARPGLGYALERISAGHAEGLVVAELSRLTNSVPELGRVLEWVFHSDVRLIAAVPWLDTEEPGGRIAVRILIDLSQSERERLAERTRKGMRAARSMGPPAVADSPELMNRIAGMRADGMTLQAIADQLNTEEVPTVRGGAIWRPSSVQAAAGYRRPRVPRTLGLPAGRPGASGGGAENEHPSAWSPRDQSEGTRVGRGVGSGRPRLARGCDAARTDDKSAADDEDRGVRRRDNR